MKQPITLSPIVNDRFPRNRVITVLEMMDEVMMKESGPGRSLLVQRMMAKGINMLCKAKVDRVEEDKIYYTQNNEQHVIEDADTLVFATGYRSDPAMEEMLKEAGNPYHLIGDAKQARSIKDAIFEGYDVAKQI